MEIRDSKITDPSICVAFDSSVWQWLLYNEIIIQVYWLHNSWIGWDSGTEQNDGAVKVIVLHEQWICEEHPELPQYPQNDGIQPFNVLSAGVNFFFFLQQRLMKKKRTNSVEWELNTEVSYEAPTKGCMDSSSPAGENRRVAHWWIKLMTYMDQSLLRSQESTVYAEKLVTQSATLVIGFICKHLVWVAVYALLQDTEIITIKHRCKY